VTAVATTVIEKPAELAAESPVAVPAIVPVVAAEPVVQSAIPDQAAAEPAPPVATAPAPTPIVVALAPVVVPPPAVQPIDLSASLQQAGLQLVETSSSAAPTTVPTPQALGRKPRATAVLNAEPLQMVETKRD
jgi:hypothetical protein